MARGDGPPPFDEFDRQIEKANRAEGRRHDRAEADQSSRLRWGDGIQVGVEVIAGVVGGTLLGYGIDWLFGTGPLFLVVFFFLGSAAGMLNAYRSMRRFTRDDPSPMDGPR
jgi:ATP synthase protein I